MNDGDMEFPSDHVASDSDGENEDSDLDEVVHTRMGRDNEGQMDVGLLADEDMSLDSPLLHDFLTSDPIVALQKSSTAPKRSAEPSTAEPDWDF